MVHAVQTSLGQHGRLFSIDRERVAAVEHDRLEVERVKLWKLFRRHFVELVVELFLNVLPHYRNVVVSVVAILLVMKSDRVQQFVNDRAEVEATIAE